MAKRAKRKALVEAAYSVKITCRDGYEFFSHGKNTLHCFHWNACCDCLRDHLLDRCLLLLVG